LKMKMKIIVIAVILLMSEPAGVFGSWGLEVGRADAGDVAGLVSDWLSFKRGRDHLRLHEDAQQALSIARQMQLLGMEGEDLNREQLFERMQEYWLNNLIGPLQRIALNPAASCAEARFALTQMLEIKKQRQLWGLEESEPINSAFEATEEMASLRCRDEALDECVATGRFKQIIELMLGTERQMQLRNIENGDHESWAEDALKQCAIYELHFLSRSKSSVTLPPPAERPGEIETVRDGRVQIRLEIPPGGLMSAVRMSLGEVLSGKNEKSPFFVSVKCQSAMLSVEWICSPGADSKPIKVWINDLDLRHREFYIGYEKDKRLPFEFKETEISKERMVGEDKFSFVFEGGEFELQGLLKHKGYTSDLPMEDQKSSFYMAHRKDWIVSNRVAIEGKERGLYPAVFQFTYTDKYTARPRILYTDSTEFELIHKPEPKPFRKVPEPIRKPLKPPPGE
jgi:hypothetical protein